MWFSSRIKRKKKLGFMVGVDFIVCLVYLWLFYGRVFFFVMLNRFFFFWVSVIIFGVLVFSFGRCI